MVPDDVLPDPGSEGKVHDWWERLNEDPELQTMVGGFFVLTAIGCALLHAPVPVCIIVVIPGAWILRARMYKDRLW